VTESPSRRAACPNNNKYAAARIDADQWWPSGTPEPLLPTASRPSRLHKGAHFPIGHCQLNGRAAMPAGLYKGLVGPGNGSASESGLSRSRSPGAGRPPAIGGTDLPPLHIKARAGVAERRGDAVAIACYDNSASHRLRAVSQRLCAGRRFPSQPMCAGKLFYCASDGSSLRAATAMGARTCGHMRLRWEPLGLRGSWGQGGRFRP
jgi:hypothetical protein